MDANALSWTPVVASVAGAAIAGGVTGVINAVVTAKRSGKTESIIQTSIAALGDRVTKIEGEQKDQWSKLGEHNADIG